MLVDVSFRGALRPLGFSAFVLLLGSLFASLLPGHAAALAFPAEWKDSDGDFYQLPPASVADSEALGTVIRWQKFKPSAAMTVGGDGLFAYRMIYVSQGANSVNGVGDRTLVSGAVMIPIRLHTQSYRQIVGFSTGTQGMGDKCAATYGIENSTNYDLAYMRRAVDEGWTVAVTDYQGLGPKTSQFQGGRADEHPEIVGQALGRNVLDAVRAARQFNNQFNADRAAYGDWLWQLKTAAIRADMSQFSRVLLWGYSEGGIGAVAAAELQPTYAPELNVVGLAAGGIPADAVEVGRAVNRVGYLQNVAFGVLMATAIGYKASYPDLPFEDKLNADGLALIANIKNQCLADIILHNFGGKRFEDYSNGNYNPLSDTQWLSKFAANKLGSVPPKVPVFLYHATLDEAIEFNQARALAKTYCNAGVKVNWNTYVGEHAVGWVGGLDAALGFLKSLANNLPVVTTPCGSI